MQKKAVWALVLLAAFLAAPCAVCQEISPSKAATNQVIKDVIPKCPVFPCRPGAGEIVCAPNRIGAAGDFSQGCVNLPEYRYKPNRPAACWFAGRRPGGTFF